MKNAGWGAGSQRSRATQPEQAFKHLNAPAARNLNAWAVFMNRGFRISFPEAVIVLALMWLYSAGHTETRNSRSRRGVCDEPTHNEKISRCIQGTCGEVSCRIGST